MRQMLEVSAATAADSNNNGELMAMVNHLMNVKDSRWLQLEVCREYQRGQCTRSDLECKFAHPPQHVEVQNGKVTACYDSIKGRCQRENPKCKYLHPPQHLKDQLLINGKNNLALKNLLMSQMSNPLATALVNPLAVQAAAGAPSYAMTPGVAAYSPYFAAATALNAGAALYHPGLVQAAASPEALPVLSAAGQAQGAASPVSFAVQQQQQVSNHKGRNDRIEVCREFLRGACRRPDAECKYAHPGLNVERRADGSVQVCMDFVRTKACSRASQCRYFHPPTHLQQSLEQQQNALLVNCNGSSLPAACSTTVAAVPSQKCATAALSPTAAAGNALWVDLMYDDLLNRMKAVHAAAAAAAASANQQTPGPLPVGKKRPLEQTDPTAAAMAAAANAAALASIDPLLLATLQQAQTAKRPALEKSGLPVYQPMSHAAMQPMSLAAYPQFATFPGVQTYVPATAISFNTHAAALGTSQHTSGAANCATGLAAAAGPALTAAARLPPTNAASVAYFDESGQLLDTLPVCRDFKQGHCERQSCRYVHLSEDYVEIVDGKVVVCRDFAKGKCSRLQCKYYHVPVLPPQQQQQTMVLNRLLLPQQTATLSMVPFAQTGLLGLGMGQTAPWASLDATGLLMQQLQASQGSV